MDPLQETQNKELEIAINKDAILQNHFNNKYSASKFFQSSIINATIPEIRNYLKEIEEDGYIVESKSQPGTFVKSHTADLFIRNGGYEAQYTAEAVEAMKYRKIEKQEGFIRFVKVIKSGAWLVGFIISVGINIFFVLKFLLKLF